MRFKPLILRIRNQKLRKVCDLPEVMDLTPELSTQVLKCSSPLCCPGAVMPLTLRVGGRVSSQGRGGSLPVSKSGRERDHGFTSARAGIPTFCFSFWLKYLQLRNISVGNHAYEDQGAEQSGMAICQYFYKQGNICPGNDTFDIDPQIETGNALLYAGTFTFHSLIYLSIQ